MKWTGISGTWQLTSQQVEEDVRREVKKILSDGGGIITGGALGVDSFAMDEDKESYYARNGTIVDLSDELYAFQVNGSSGTGDTVEKAKSQGKEVRLFNYNL